MYYVLLLLLLELTPLELSLPINTMDHTMVFIMSMVNITIVSSHSS